MYIKARHFQWTEIVIDSELPSLAKYICLYLSTFMNSKQNMAFPGLKRIESETGLSRPTIIKYLKETEEYGLLVIDHGDSKTPNKYHAKIPDSVVNEVNQGSKGDLLGVVKDVNQGSKAGLPGVVKHVNPNRQVNRQVNKQSDLSQQNKFSEDDMLIAKLIFSGVKRLIPSAKKPNLETWANDVRKIRQLDNRSSAQIKQTFTWANNDSFWQSNILSPAKLRKQFDVLTLQRTANNNGNGDNVGVGNVI